jgi:methylated-DNA-protein-cysteine methyltransferase-like protein
MGPTSSDPRTQRILATVDCIPQGKVATYGQVAREAGLPGRARLVGHVLAGLPQGSRLPWHRVLTASGQISSRPGPGSAEQRYRLEEEGVGFNQAGRADLKTCAWDPEATG